MLVCKCRKTIFLGDGRNKALSSVTLGWWAFSELRHSVLMPPVKRFSFTASSAARSILESLFSGSFSKFAFSNMSAYSHTSVRKYPDGTFRASGWWYRKIVCSSGPKSFYFFPQKCQDPLTRKQLTYRETRLRDLGCEAKQVGGICSCQRNRLPSPGSELIPTSQSSPPSIGPFLP